MAPQRDHRPRAIPLVLGLLLSAMLWLGACAKPAVTGNVLPAESERSGLPWLRVDVRLVRGALMDQLAPLAAKHREEAEAAALKAVLDAAKNEYRSKTEAAQRARAALERTNGGTAPAAIRACLPAAEAALAAAKREHRATLVDLTPRIVATGVRAADPDDAIARLQAAVRVKVASEARRLRDEYLSTQLVQESGTVLTAGSRMDRLCWTVHNNHDLAVRFRGLTLLYNERELPPAVAAQLWRLPPRDQALRMPGSRGVDNDLLMPGAQYEACFYANRTSIPVDVLDRYGLSTENPNRNGQWRVRWDDIELVAPAAADARDRIAAAPPAADMLAAAFAGRLRQFEEPLEERKLIAALRSSAGARAVAAAEAGLLACHQAIEKDKAVREVERVIQAIEDGRGGDSAVRARLQPLLQKSLHEATRIAKWVTEASAFLDRATVARQEQALGAAYRFENVDPGAYTLVATSAIDTERPKVWLIPLAVSGPMAQDLVAATARDIPLRQTLESVLLGTNG